MTQPDHFERLETILREEADRYRRLAVIGNEQKDLLVAGDMGKLPENVRAAEREVFALGPLGTARNETIAALGRVLGMTDSTLTSIAEKAPEQRRDSLRAAVAEVVSAAKSLDAVNQGNEKLLENAVQYVQFTLSALSGGAKTKDTYTPSATTPKNQVSPATSTLNRVV